MDRELIELGRKVAFDVYKAVREERGRNLRLFGNEVAMGADGTPSEYIDIYAEKVAMKTMSESPIRVNLFSEEAGFVDNDGEWTFIIDPIDGTRNAKRNIPFYCTSVAIGKGKLSTVEYGIVINIPTGDVYESEKGKGATLNGIPINISMIHDEKPIYATVLGRSGTERMYSLATSKKTHIRSLNACAMEMCLVATGALDAFFMDNPKLRITDFAASALILREAGGVVLDECGKELDCNTSFERRCGMIAAKSMKTVEEMLHEIGPGL
ncbi:MAG: inositol monophosphatase [Thermoplasmata archaeon HGW-Thermoplasmata-1]|nr:MAG: inositol monophosphatase [Thermoplasmata archaeon HGW-Thermoplasmata-1]